MSLTNCGSQCFLLKPTCAAQYVAISLQVALKTSPKVAKQTMIANPIDRSHRFRIFANGMYVAAPITLVTTAITGINECDAKALVTYAERLLVMEDWKALTK